MLDHDDGDDDNNDGYNDNDDGDNDGDDDDDDVDCNDTTLRAHTLAVMDGRHNRHYILVLGISR
ncbi:hypothetical protein RhiirA5_430146 [Rhizophagus irregularis]|uniref:Uncharacterized protein n=1 Tax=Rhizophagus irregularis TaxID=588596 RepID=A0A2N0NX92_9GLOM|nr:hypothetical protein RhiirA5_430146 [Rhizophagus irregularis]PKC59150.1 hypothetical protein RhiirA1_469865 [Rhizophagus irregularis]